MRSAPTELIGVGIDIANDTVEGTLGDAELSSCSRGRQRILPAALSVHAPRLTVGLWIRSWR